MEEARRIRSERPSKTLTQFEREAAICDGIIRFQEEHLGWRSDSIHAHLVKDLMLIRMRGVLTLAERQLGKSSPANRNCLCRGWKTIVDLSIEKETVTYLLLFDSNDRTSGA